MKRLLLLSPLLLLFLPLPVRSEPGILVRCALVLYFGIWEALMLYAKRVAPNLRNAGAVARHGEKVLVVMPLLGFFLLTFFGGITWSVPALILILLHAAGWGMYAAFESELQFAGLSSLAFAISSFLALEWGMQSLPPAVLPPVGDACG